MLDSYFTFNEVSSTEFGIIIKNEPTIVKPRRRYDSFSISSKNGNYIDIKDTFDNIELTYTVKFGKDFLIDGNIHEKAQDIADWLYGAAEYSKLSDSYNPDTFREACFVGPLDIDNQLEKFGTADITFICKPQKFLTQDINGKSSASSVSYTNPTNYASSPLIKLTTNNSVPPSLLNWWNRTEINEDDYSVMMTDKYYIHRATNVSLTKSGGISLTGSDGHVSMSIRVNPNTQYSWSRTMSSSSTIGMRANMYDYNGKHTRILPSNSLGVTTEENEYYIMFSFYGTNTYTNIQVQRGSSASTYSAADTDKSAILVVNGKYMEISPCYGTVYIDCNKMYVYMEDGSIVNNYLSIADDGKFPKLKPGSNSIGLQSGHHGDVTLITVYPRWWRL